MSRCHSTRVADVSSFISWINASIIQGSGLGSSSYVVAAMDLHPRHRQNLLTKFADDTYLLMSSASIGTIKGEYDSIVQWAEKNNTKIHPSKMKELIVYRARSRTTLEPLPPLIEGAERVTTLRVLGVMVDSRLIMSDHVSQVLSACSSSMFALRLLRTHGLKREKLHLMARATTIGSILYAIPT